MKGLRLRLTGALLLLFIESAPLVPIVGGIAGAIAGMALNILQIAGWVE